ncbi:MAG TPA: MEDS domain-containing protein, partial [Acidimicrobiales bacterium]|nr:MEDS domain-containing protein [Acidimicrobiales bacterium]
SAGRLLLLDAHETLSRISAQGSLQPARFGDVVGGVIRRAGWAERPVRAYGEMVAVLWERGNVAGAIELEGLWDKLIRQLPFALFCAYPLRSVGDVECDAEFAHVCRLHSQVIGGAPVPAAAESSRRFVAGMAAAALARRYVTATLEDWGRPGAIHDALIVVSELAANAVQYAGGDFTVSLSRLADSLRLTVGDPNPDPPRLGTPGPLALGGRGMRMIDRIAAAWGHDRAGAGKLVWVDLAA